MGDFVQDRGDNAPGELFPRVGRSEPRADPRLDLLGDPVRVDEDAVATVHRVEPSVDVHPDVALPEADPGIAHVVKVGVERGEGALELLDDPLHLVGQVADVGGAGDLANQIR